jgi:methylenetetrahydrofolate dehydrogenase (NADP+)/methenyltetrahydrofolate cyclohydrolase
VSELLDGKAVAAAIRAEVAQGVEELVASGGRPPGLTVVLVGDDPASQVYVGSKVRACTEVGMVSRKIARPAATTQEELAAIVDELNQDETIDGMLLQLPLPRHIEERPLLERILPAKDVDGFHPVNAGRLWLDLPGFVPATPAGILELLKRRGTPLAGRRAVVVGRSNTVGKPMAALLLRENCTVTLCHSKTADLAAVAREGDILIAAVGRPGLVSAEHVKDGAVVIDVGINRVSDRATVERLFPGDARKLAHLEQKGAVLVGDVDFVRVAPKASAITPVPGGVGPLTVAMLLVNTLKAARRRQGLDA